MLFLQEAVLISWSTWLSFGRKYTYELDFYRLIYEHVQFHDINWRSSKANASRNEWIRVMTDFYRLKIMNRSCGLDVNKSYVNFYFFLVCINLNLFHFIKSILGIFYGQEDVHLRILHLFHSNSTISRVIYLSDRV